MPGGVGTVDVCVHATGPYLGYARSLANTLSQHWSAMGVLRLVVFTDEPEKVTWHEELTIGLVAIKVPHRPWPYSSMRRFEDYARHAEALSSEILVFLDADMSIVSAPESGFAEVTDESAVVCVAHPGFYQRRRGQHWKHSPWPEESSGSLGSWEDRQESLAYVPPSDRRVYVCGGVWIGRRTEALALCAELAVRIELDERTGVTAVWHDESHLNWWAATYRPALLSPSYCFVPSYKHLSGLPIHVVALDKPAEFVKAVKGE